MELDFVIHPMVQQAQGILRIFERYQTFFRPLCPQYLETRIDVVPKLIAEVHARSHRWTLGLNIPEGGNCQDAGCGNVSDIFLC